MREDLETGKRGAEAERRERVGREAKEGGSGAAGEKDAVEAVEAKDAAGIAAVSLADAGGDDAPVKSGSAGADSSAKDSAGAVCANGASASPDASPAAPPKPSVKPLEPPKKVPPEKPAKWEYAILAGALAMGLCFNWIWRDQGMLPLSLLWLVMAGMLLFTPGAFQRRNAIAYMALGTAALSCVSTFFFDSEWMLMLINLVAAPGLLMAAAVWAQMDREAEGEHLFLLEYLLSWIVRPFAGIPRFFAVFRGVLPGKGNPTALRVLVGLLISVPLLAVVIGLLMTADAYFSSALENALGAIRLDAALGHILRVAVPMVLFFSFLVTYWKKPFMEIAHPPRANWDRVILSTVLVALLFIYALFCGFQFFYLFGGHEAFVESGYTYAEYARRGFSEMSLVCGINLFLFWLAVRFAKPGRGVSALLAGLLAATVVMLISAGLRLGLYIQAYGLTMQRVRAAWMIGVMAAIVIACGAKLARPGLPIVRAAAAIVMAAFLGLQLAMPDAIVARSDAARLRAQWNEDTLWYLYTLSSDAVPAMIDLYGDRPEPELREMLQGRHESLEARAREGRWMSVSAMRAYRMLDDLVQAGRL